MMVMAETCLIIDLLSQNWLEAKQHSNSKILAMLCA